ncbi:MAG TPA: 16S rRNA (uracil(1498)-N(3))-methyltransferase [Coriobacteriia bacterium]
MTLHRFFVRGELPPTGAVGSLLELSPADLHHARRVLRLAPGDRVVVADESGRQAEATLVQVGESGVMADLGPTAERLARPYVVLAAGISRRERMEFTVQKTTELGVAEIWPLATARCVVRLDEDRAGKRSERWSRIAAEAAKQSQRTEVPLVREPMTIAALAAEAARFDIVLVPWEEEASSAPGIGEALDAACATGSSSVLVVVGPEGGFEASEVEEMRAVGAVAVSLGDTVLRTETAAAVAVALVSYELGALGGRGR